MKQSNTDFGWRYKGRWIGVHRDLSREGTPDAVSHADGRQNFETTLTCLQCGVCTASCHLAKDNSVFPRREMSLVQGGLTDRAINLPSIWHCYQCDDCTEGCPSLAGPSEVMAQLRAKATCEFSTFPDLARLLNTKEGVSVLFGFAFIIMAVLGINFSNHVWEQNTVSYRAMYPHHLLIPVFSGLTLLSFGLLFVSVVRAWRTWTRQSPAITVLNGVMLWKSIGQAIYESIRHTRFAACEANRYRRHAHMLIAAGFAGLCGIALFAAMLPLLKMSPEAFQKPFTAFKLLANAFSFLFIAGIGMFIFYRISLVRKQSPAAFSDWIFPLLLAAVAFSGLACQWTRWANVAIIAYPAYLFHLSFVFVLLAMLPFGKSAHALYRLAAEAHRIYLEKLALPDALDDSITVQPRFGKSHNSPQKEAVDITFVIETPYLLSHEQAIHLPDTVVIDTYNALRDAYEKVDGEKRFYNIENLYGTAFEREKDRRELAQRQNATDTWESSIWYTEAANNTCVWWLQNQLLARRSLRSCMFCGMCTAVCPAAGHYVEYNPRSIVDAALSGNEDEIIALLKSDAIWYCGQCGSCKERCPRANSVMGLVSSLRILAQLKGYHVYSRRGRQQYASRYLWGGNFWNRGCSLYFRNGDKWAHPDFGPNYENFFDHQEQEFLRLGANPDRLGMFGGRKINPETLNELRSLVEAGGSLCLWKKVDDFGNDHRFRLNLSEESYLELITREG